MEMLSSTLAGIPNESSWSQVYARRLGDGFCGVVLSLRSPLADVSTLGKKLIDHCIEASRDGMTRESFLTLFREFGIEGIDISAVLVHSESATLFTQGNVNIQLTRGRKSQALATGSPTGAYIQGTIAPGDYYILATSAFTKQFPVLDPSTSPQETTDLYVSLLHGLSQSADMAALFLSLPASNSPVTIPQPEGQARQEAQSSKMAFKMPQTSIRFPKISLVSLLPRTEKGKKAGRLVGLLTGAVFVLIILSWYMTSR